MKLLLDQNLSRNLVEPLQASYPGTTHVSLVSLETASDRQIWEHAGEHGYAIASKDSDFRQLAFLFGPPPKVLWLRAGNASTATLLQLLLTHRSAIEAFDADPDEALLVIPELPPV